LHKGKPIKEFGLLGPVIDFDPILSYIDTRVIVIMHASHKHGLVRKDRRPKPAWRSHVVDCENILVRGCGEDSQAKIDKAKAMLEEIGLLIG